jgi:hypothetical protein
MPRLAIAAFTLLSASLASAQPRSPEIFALGGIARVVDDEGSLGTGPAVAGAIQFPFTRRVAVDVDLAWASASRSFSSGVEFETRQWLFNPSVVYRWGSERTYAFAGGGVGYDSSGDAGTAINAKGGVVTNLRGGLLFRADVVAAWRFVLPHVQARAGIGYRF